MSDQREALTKMLADAISFGTRLSELRYARPIQDEEAAAVRRSIEDLRASTRAFLDSVSLGSLTDQAVFPLCDEIAHNLTMRSDTCTREKK